MGWRWLLCTLVLSGCIEPQLQRCGELLCARDSVCLPNNQCATQEAVDACAAKVDGDDCSTTLFDGTCSGGACVPARCGDGLVSGSEQCDGAVTGVDCAEYGFDLGIPACTDRCSLDVVDSCTRFGWRRVLAQQVYQMWTDGTRYAVISPDQKVLGVYVNGQLQASHDLTTKGEFFNDVAGDATRVVGLLGTAIVESTGGAFAELPAPPMYSDYVEIGNDGTIYVASFDAGRCRAWRLVNAAWEPILDTIDMCKVFRFADGQLLLGTYGNVLRWTGNGTEWAGLFGVNGELKHLDAHDGAIYVGTTAEGVKYANGALSVFDLEDPGEVVALDKVYGGGQSGAQVWRYTAANYEMFSAPIGGWLVGDGTDLYIYGNGIYVYTGRTYANRTGLTAGATDLAMLGGHVAIASGGYIQFPISDTVWGAESSPRIQLELVAGASTKSFFAADIKSLEHFENDLFTAIPVPWTGDRMRDLAWLPETSTLLVVGDGQLGYLFNGATWTGVIPPAGTAGCDLLGVTHDAPSTYAVGTCGSQGVVWSLGGTTWTEIHRAQVPLVAIWVDGLDNIYATGPTATVMRIEGTWSTDDRATGISISATSPTDVWVGGGPQDVVHYNGTYWSRLRVTGAAKPRVLATSEAVYVGGVAQPVLLR